MVYALDLHYFVIIHVSSVEAEENVKVKVKIARRTIVAKGNNFFSKDLQVFVGWCQVSNLFYKPVLI